MGKEEIIHTSILESLYAYSSDVGKSHRFTPCSSAPCPSPPSDTHYALGTPDDIARTIQTFADIGVTHFAFSNARPPHQVMPQIQTLAQQVIPHFR